MPEGLEASDEPARLGLWTSAMRKVVGTEVLITLAGREHVPGSDQDGVGNGDGRLVHPSPSSDLAELARLGTCLWCDLRPLRTR